jgi:2-dehydro-3-deoxygalactonokinase
MSGMVGSMNGWLETSYVTCDASLNQISRKLVRIPNIKEKIYIVPGVKSLKGDNIDLMRGEEIQIFGALKLLNKKDAMFILPGTHSKWVEVNNEKICNFKTNMTGEVFNLLSSKSILAKSISSTEINEDIFKKGLELSLTNTGLLNQIFQARAQSLLIGEENVYSFLSGILIGNEIKEMNTVYKIKELIIVGSSSLNTLYTLGFSFYNIKIQTVNSMLATQESMKVLYMKIKEEQSTNNKSKVKKTFLDKRKGIQYENDI